MEAYLGVPNKAVSSTSVQSCPLTWLQLPWEQPVLKDSHRLSRDRLSGWEQPSW